MIKKKISSIITILLIILLLSPNSLAIGEINTYGKTVVVAGDNNYPPYEYLDSSGDFKGFNVDIIRAVAIELGWDIELIPTSWENCVLLLKEGKVDAVQGMTITPERDEVFDFTEEIVINSQSIFVLKDTTYISELSDLEGRTVSIQSEDVTQELIKDVPNMTIIEKVNQLDAIKLLLNGEVDAFVGNRLTGIYNIQRFDLTETVKTVGSPLYTTFYSIAVKSGDDNLLEQLNSGLEAIKKNGTYEKIYKKWFGETFVDVNRGWKNLLIVVILVLIIALIGLALIYYWNKNLKTLVNARTKELDQSNRFKSNIIDNIVDGLVTFDEFLIVKQFNAKVTELLEKNIYDGQSYEELADGKIPLVSKDFALEGKIWSDNLEWKLIHGSIKYVSCNLIPIKGPTGVEGFILSIDDKTQEIELYNLAKHNDKMQSLGVLSSGLAHELRNPLTSIKTFINLIPLKMNNDNFKQELMNIVPKELNRLDDLISSMLNYSKPKKPNPRMVLLDNVLDEIVTLFRKKFNENKINIIRKNTHTYLYVDESQLKQILINVILNSIDAIEDNGFIEIDTYTLDKKNTIIISDNGPGIPKEVINKMFEPFYSSKNTGFGIGLTITDRLIRENKGDISIESEIGEGTKVIINLPNQKIAE